MFRLNEGKLKKSRIGDVNITNNKIQCGKSCSNLPSYKLYATITLAFILGHYGTLLYFTVFIYIIQK